MQKGNYTNTATASGGQGKYPLSTQTLDFIQQQITLLQQLGFIGGNKKAPTPAPAADMARILAKVEESHAAPAPKLEYIPGEEVAIVEGPFKDFNGTVESVNYNQQKLKVGVSIFGRVTQVDLDFGHVAKTV